eukprot:CAMPEP_0197832580 /NCGR_PEP_ID=MMETSP1437-20131217/15283_1 /TAXON_ID=49252 ORGANISM="Eucampia antarctica, Strain CCMP1452" /NCGR_SAMPLE_ID=MMETSP1437 /ASSEMBLY_ACC=CAM_ASM_001096 /LENGTH=666 /DNA_ID=CAMNT_0043436019 /DNA_START=109 /DNA_END=2109 /DNA_ORIENTATION=-
MATLYVWSSSSSSSGNNNSNNSQVACAFTPSSIVRHRSSNSNVVLSSSSASSSGSGSGSNNLMAELYERKRRPKYIPGVIDDPDYVRIFDTTLRDGEQSPGATLTSDEKLEIAKMLAKLGVDIIEAGFPIASPDDFAGVKQIADIVGNDVYEEDDYVPVICGLSRANTKDIQCAWDAVKSAKRPRIHTFIATSSIHMETKLKKTPEEVTDIAVKAVTFAKSLGCDDIEFSPEDAGRSDPVFLYDILSKVIVAGATTLNIPDTTGWNMPWEFGDLLSKLRANVVGADKVIFSTHCQNDLGLATANSLSGARNGARQLECTINGIGERAGNASLEEIVMSLALKGNSQFDITGTGNLYTAVNPVYITPTSKMVVKYSGMMCQPHKAIVGANAFQHESGIHQDGMIKNKSTYEIMTPESIGLMRGDSQSGAGIVLGKHSGRNAVSTRLKELGYDLELDQFNALFARFKHVAERKKGGLEDDDLEALISDQASNQHQLWEVTGLQVTTGLTGIPTATVKMCGPDGMERYLASTGTGPVDAVYKAIDQIIGVSVNLEAYHMNAVTEGIEALASTRVTISPVVGGPNDSIGTDLQTGLVREHKFTGSGSDTDIVTSSARAYVSALNKLLNWTLRQKKLQSSTPTDNTNNEEAAKEQETEVTETQSEVMQVNP